MQTGLAVADLDGLLDEPLVAVLATNWRDGSVLLSPVWHEWRDGGFNVWTDADGVKARALRLDPRASIVVAESAFPMRAVEVRTEATLIEDGAEEAAIRIAARYIDAEKGRAYVESTHRVVLVRLTPGELRAWDYRDEQDDLLGS